MVSKNDVMRGLKIEAINAWTNELCSNGCIRIAWSSAAGWGYYDFFITETGEIHGYSENMESTEDKYLSKELLRLFHEKIVVEG